MVVAAMHKHRGHEVLVVAASAHLDFFKQAAARHSSNSTAEALRYLSVDLAAAAKGRKPAAGGRQVKPGQVTQSRFAGEQRLAAQQQNLQDCREVGKAR
jgi:hypothetical protein